MQVHCMTCLLHSLYNNTDGITEVEDLQSGLLPLLSTSHSETDLNRTSTRSDQYLFDEEPASESENLNLKQGQCQSWIYFFLFFSRSIWGYTLETNDETSCH